MLDFLMDAAFEFGSALGDACRGAADACFYPAPRHYYPRPSWADGRKWYPLFAEVEEYFEQVVGPTLKYSVDTASWKFQKSYYMNAWLNLERVHAAAQGSLARADRYDDWREIREEADNMRSVLNRMIELAMRMMADIQRLRDSLPGIDCGACGAPNCRALAEDIIKGKAQLQDCKILEK